MAALMIAYLGLSDQQIKLQNFMGSGNRKTDAEITLDQEFAD